MMTSTYPEHEKLTKIADKSQAIGEFLEYAKGEWCTWVEDEDYTISKGSLARYIVGEDDNYESDTPGGYWEPAHNIQRVLAEFFGIDQEKLEAEKRAMLDALRTANETA